MTTRTLPISGTAFGLDHDPDGLAKKKTGTNKTRALPQGQHLRKTAKDSSGKNGTKPGAAVNTSRSNISRPYDASR